MREIMDSSDLNLVKVHGGGGYDSDFSDDEDTGGTSQHGKKRKHDELLQKPFQQGKHTKVAHKSLAAEEWDREEARNRRHHLISMNAFERHKKFVGDYIMYYGGKMTDFKRSVVSDKTDFDVVRENHRFLWREEDHEDMTWEKELAKKYYDKLFKEYCISDLSRYKENKFGFRWRTESEVVSGKGQFFCGNKRCEQKEGLKTWEVNFAYVEHGEKRNALVKLRLCPECSYKLNYHHKRKEFKAKKKIKAEVKRESKTGKSSRQKQRRRKSKEHSTTTSSEDSEDSNKDPESSEEVEAEEDEASSETDHWKGPAPSIEEKSKEEEFDDYFEDMFL